MSALAISPTTANVNVTKTKTFIASGGTAPYIFSIVSGLGSIGASSGIYTAATSPGPVVIKVTDSAMVPATVQATITVNNALTLFCDILKTEMSLDADQVYLWDQKINIPTDSRLYIAVGVSSCKPFANNREMLSVGGGGLDELLTANFLAKLSVDILSRGTDARDRKEEILLALSSIYAEQIQEGNGIFVGILSDSFVNLSEIDGAAIPYRFNIAVNLQYQVSKRKSVPYYDTFTDSVITEA